MLEMAQLKGLSLEVAELYGKPHLGAYYEGDSIKSHKWDGHSSCAICGLPASNVHHVSHQSKGYFTLKAGLDEFKLKPALFALCGTGTTGCHDKFHGSARLKARWIWRDESFADYWWSGEMLKRFGAHNPALYAYGSWQIYLDGKELVMLP